MANLLTKLWLTKLWRNQKGQDMTEYALIAGAMASMAVPSCPQ